MMVYKSIYIYAFVYLSSRATHSVDHAVVEAIAPTGQGADGVACAASRYSYLFVLLYVISTLCIK